jgi:hypothetical protein
MGPQNSFNLEGNVEGKRGREIRKGNGGVSMIKLHYMHTWKCHNETPYFVQLVNANFKK